MEPIDSEMAGQIQLKLGWDVRGHAGEPPISVFVYPMLRQLHNNNYGVGYPQFWKHGDELLGPHGEKYGYCSAKKFVGSVNMNQGQVSGPQVTLLGCGDDEETQNWAFRDQWTGNG